MAVLPGSHKAAETLASDLQTGAPAHTDTKGQFGEVTNHGAWRTQLSVIKAALAGKVSPSLSRQEARKLMREAARNTAQAEKLRGRKGRHR